MARREAEPRSPDAGGRPSRGRELWRSLRWPALALAVLAATALGVIGFDRYFRQLGQPRPATDLLYLAIQLFTLESGSVAGPRPWQLELARFLAPGLAVFTAAQALAVVFRDELRAVRARRKRGHVVICGLGRKGQLLARRFRAAGAEVVAIESDEGNDSITVCRDAGVVVLLGDATEPSMLRRAGVARAERLISVCGSDGDNATIAVAARRMTSGRSGRPLVAVVHLLDDELCALLRERELAALSRDGFRLEFFNVFETGAEAMLEEIPWRSASRPHVVIVGLGHFGWTLLRRVLRWRDDGGAPFVTVVDRDPAQLARARVTCESVERLAICELDVRSPAFAAAAFALDEHGRSIVDGVYVCLDDDGAALAAALAVHRRLGGSGVPIAVRLEEEAGLATLLAGDPEGDSGYGDLQGFGLLERTCRTERLLAVSRERLAQAIHASYLAGRLAAGRRPKSDPALVPWARLPEELRESNRDQADDIARKLALVDCEAHVAGPIAAEPFAFSPAEVERLVELEHERFVAERTASGWSYASGEKSLEQRTSPHLLPWSALDEAEREIDRRTVRGLPEFLAKIGFEIRRGGRVRAGGDDR